MILWMLPQHQEVKKQKRTSKVDWLSGPQKIGLDKKWEAFCFPFFFVRKDEVLRRKAFPSQKKLPP